jgi:ABC-2 type transport system ATP-binding protein
MSDAISVHNVSKVYRLPSLVWQRPRRKQALREVSFRCPREQISCLLGPNGAGKTTIIKILAGLILPDAGDAVTLGMPLSRAPLSFRARIGLASPNERSFYWRLTGRQNLDFYAALYSLGHAERKRRVAEILAEVELEEDADKQVRFYSAGMKQKLLLARALLGQPEILLLDEPTTHLDPLARAAVHRLIRERFVAGRRASVLLCSHDLTEAQELADHLIFLHQGEALVEGTLPSLRARLQPQLRLRLEFAEPPRAGWAEGLPATKEEAVPEENAIELELGDETAIPSIVEAAIAGGGRLLSCQRREESLAKIFRRFTAGDVE